MIGTEEQEGEQAGGAAYHTAAAADGRASSWVAHCACSAAPLTEQLLALR